MKLIKEGTTKIFLFEVNMQEPLHANVNWYTNVAELSRLMVILYCKIGDKKDMNCLKYAPRCGTCLISEQRLGALVDLIVTYSFFL